MRAIRKIPAFLFLSMLIVSASLLVPLQTKAVTPSQDVSQGFSDLAERLIPSVVNISIRATVAQQGNAFKGTPFEFFFREFQQQQPFQNKKTRKVTSLGSGFIIDSSGIIVTNNHVIKHADEIEVNLSNGEKYKAKVLGRDIKTDLAVLKIDVPYKLPFVKFSSGDNKTRVGDWVIAIGNPFGLGESVTAGIVSALHRNINSGPYDSYIQTDAAINKGNSGGPLFDLAGNVVGVNTAIISPSGGSVGIGFAIPADLASNIVTQLRNFGKATRGWLGVQVQEMTDELAHSLGLKKSKGALIAELSPEGPAKKAGLKVGDVILSFDRKSVDNMKDLPRIVAETSVNKRVRVSVLRRGKIITKFVIIRKLDEGEAEQVSELSQSELNKKNDRSVLGLKLRVLTKSVRKKFNLKPQDGGVQVVAINSDSLGNRAGIRIGDIITEIDYRIVQTPTEVVQQVELVKKSGKKSVLALLHTQHGRRFVALKISP